MSLHAQEQFLAAVAAALGESIAVIRRRGFHLELEPYDLDPWPARRKAMPADAEVDDAVDLAACGRGSCSDDLERRGVAEKAINAWIGNTAHLRRRHYHAVRPEDWAAVTGKAAQIPARAGEFRSDQEPSALHGARKKTLVVRNDAQNQYPRQGSNL